MKPTNRYTRIIERIFFDHYTEGATEVSFDREDITRVAVEMKIDLPKNLGDVVGVPKSGQFCDRVCLWDPAHRFFACLNRRISFLVIGRAVTGYPLPSGNSITTQNR